MKMAIVHDGLIHVGGAEKVFLELAEQYQEADLFVPILNRKVFANLPASITKRIKTTLLSDIPFFYRHTNLIKPLLIFYWRSLNLTQYQLVLSSSHAFNSKLISTPKTTIHLSYVHTPPRYLSHVYNESQFLHNPILKVILKPLLSWLKQQDQESGKKPDLLIANSKTVQKRIFQQYKKPSIVVYPPCAISQKVYKPPSNGHYLCFSRLVKQKSIDLAIHACNQLKRPLVIVGDGPELPHLKQIAGPTITFTGFLSDHQLETVFSQTKALINCAVQEDFGMVTVETASRGIPVIGYKSGGLRETIQENKTGIFFTVHTVESLTKAMIKFEAHSFNPEDCHAFSKQFSKRVFNKKINTIVDYYMQKAL